MRREWLPEFDVAMATSHEPLPQLPRDRTPKDAVRRMRGDRVHDACQPNAYAKRRVRKADGTARRWAVSEATSKDDQERAIIAGDQHVDANPRRVPGGLT